jgi:hypothetical protein
MLLSWMDSANLRDKMYSQQQRIEILETALDDIDRVNAAGNRDSIIANIVRHTRK